MKGMMMLSLCMIMYMKTPLSTTLMLSALSMLISALSYNITNSTLMSSALVISFSSGLMIMFSYVSSLCKKEEKKQKKSNMLIMILMLSMLISMNNKSILYMTKSTLEMQSSISIILVMGIILICMKSMNLNIMEKSNTMKQSI